MSAPTPFDESQNLFAQIAHDDALTLDEKKEALTQALLFDITKPAESLERLQEFLTYREYLVAEKTRLIGEIGSVSMGDVIGGGEAAPAAPAEEAEAKDITGTVIGIFNSARARGSKIMENAAKVGRELDVQVKAKKEILASYELIEAASVDAARLNKEASDQLVAYVSHYNDSMSDAFAVAPGALQSMLAEGGRFIDQAAQAVNRETVTNAVSGGVKRASTAVARTAGRAVVNGSMQVIKNATNKKGPQS